MPEETSYRLYLDDSGTKEYSPSGTYSAGNTRHFVFGGPLLRTEEVARLTKLLKKLKLQTFGTYSVEIKSNWLRVKRERERRYLRRFGVSESRLADFVESAYQAIRDADLVLLAGVVDKVHMKEKYEERAWYPPAAAYEVVVQRAQMEMSEKSPESPWTVVIDDMTGATPHGNQYRTNLKRHHTQLKKTGSTLWQGYSFPKLRELVFIDSGTSHLTQAADMVAYNVFRQFREFEEEWEAEGLGRLPTYDWFARIATKFRNDGNGRIQGFGVVKVPLFNRVRWTVQAPDR